MSYRLIDANAIQIEYPKVNELSCIYVDLPNGLDNSYHFINTDDINAAHEQIGYEKGYRDGYASAIEAELIKHGWWWINDNGLHKCSVRCPNCDEQYISYPREFKYCPNCGTKMVNKDG